MREQSVPVRAWLRRSLSDRFGAVTREEIPQEMLDLLDVPNGQD